MDRRGALAPFRSMLVVATATAIALSAGSAPATTGATPAAAKCSIPTTTDPVEPGEFNPATAPKPLDACLELTMPAGPYGLWLQVSVTGSSFLTMSNIDQPRLAHGRRIKAFFARHPSVSRSSIKVAASGLIDAQVVAYAFSVPGVSGRTLLSDWVTASRPALAADMKVASERIGGRTVKTIRATEETTQYARWALVEALVPVGPVLYVVEGYEGGGVNEPAKRNAAFDLAVSQLPSTTFGGLPVAKKCDPSWHLCRRHGWPFRPPPDPALENLIPRTVSGLIYSRVSFTGSEFAMISDREGIVPISGGERLMPFYKRTGVSVSKITAGYGLATAGTPAPGTTAFGAIVFAFRIPGVAPTPLLDAWAAVTAGPNASPAIAHGIDLVLAGRTLRVVYRGFYYEYVYAVKGLMFVVVLSSDYTETQADTFVTEWVRQLPAA